MTGSIGCVCMKRERRCCHAAGDQGKTEHPQIFGAAGSEIYGRRNFAGGPACPLLKKPAAMAFHRGIRGGEGSGAPCDGTGPGAGKICPLLPNSACFLGGAAHTLGIMRQAPVLIFIVNPIGIDLHAALTLEERVFETCNAQSVGAAVENMALAATKLGLGSLWICDTYFAYPELCEWLGSGGELLAAMAVGYADEAPPARLRKSMEDAVEWRG